MKVFVISLKRAADRRKRIVEHLTSRGVDFELFDAVDGSQLTDEDFDRYCDMETVRKHPKWLTKGMIGACLSHYTIYKKILELNLPYACVVEDDVIVDNDFASLLDTIEKTMQQDKFIMLHYTSWSTIELKPEKVPFFNKYGMYEMNFNSGLNSAAGYIVTKDTCKQLVDFIIPIRMGPDSWTDFVKGGAIKTVHSIYPKPVNIVYAKSTIDYLDSKSMTSRISNLVNDYKIFPLYQLLKWRRRNMNKKMDNVKIIKK